MASSNDKRPTNPNASLLDLQQPEKLSKILEENKRDCLSCRLVGAAAFTGLGAYIYISGRSQLLEQQHKLTTKAGTLGGLRARMAGTGLLASTFVGMGLYRLVN
ncbi:hypothetical protein JMJ35_000274 [Cladonia borealis]|uniref:Distal membrane-arm assembly complex protein 1-like domain-containing protein n=1 Tax=Cladonia borealis TaxID=184061 RepID=A0AA39RB14_9LECA|nr:hypothetical protein JMJ35_000274 [Cladonia borealis]